LSNPAPVVAGIVLPILTLMIVIVFVIRYMKKKKSAAYEAPSELPKAK